MDECNPTYAPMNVNIKFKEMGGVNENSIEFKRLMGSLRYLTHTHADLMFNVWYLSRFMEKPTLDHVKTTKRILRYLKRTVNFGLIYMKGKNEAELVIHFDSNFACDKHDRKRTSTYIFFLSDRQSYGAPANKRSLLFHQVRLSISPLLLLHVNVFSGNV